MYNMYATGFLGINFGLVQPLVTSRSVALNLLIRYYL